MVIAAALLVACGPARVPDDPMAGVQPRPPASPSSPVAPSPTTPSSPVTSPTPSAVASTPAATPTPPSPQRLKLGDAGPAVLAWQRALTEHGYWLGTPDGTFGSLTRQATYAVQKVAGLQRNGIVGPATRAALRDRALPAPRTQVGRALEIDIARQVLLVVDGGRVVTVLNTSTGSGSWYRNGRRWSRAVTPRGSFSVLRQVDGLRISPLGVLWRPKYFTGGYAVHGAPQVPPWPASHGCVRLSMAAMDWLWSAGLAPIGTPVLVY
jgi:lipoprotein-anchoring transpeptidase ErfK/SrfK